jgi:MFS transporter, DHA3 family, macrolide efflux protein
MTKANRALGVPAFRRLWTAQTVSQFGDAVYGLLFLFMADRLTRDPLFVGLVMGASALPFLLFGPWAGSLADRLDRRRIMVFCETASAGVLLLFAGALALVPQPPLWSLVLVPFLLSTVNTFFFPAYGAAVPRLVPDDLVMEANSLRAASQSLMQTIGLGLALLVLGPLEAFNPGGFFLTAVLINAATFVFSSATLMRIPAIPPTEAPVHGEKPKRGEIWEGVRVIRQDGALRVMMPVMAVVNLAISGFMVVYLETNRQWFDGTFRMMAMIELSFLVSMLVGSLVIGRMTWKRFGMPFALGTTAVGLSIALMAYCRALPLYIAANVVAGLLLPLIQVPAMTYLNLAVPDQVRGRVNSVLGMLSAGIQPLGAVTTGAVLAGVGLFWMYWVMGLGMIVPALLGLLDRKFRESMIPVGSSGPEGQVPADLAESGGEGVEPVTELAEGRSL